MDPRSGRRLALAVAAVGLAAGGVSAVVFREPLVRRWHAIRLELSRPEDRWDLARRLEDSGEPARRAAEDWYLSALEAWSPDPGVIASRKPAEAATVRRADGEASGAGRGDPTFHYPDEEVRRIVREVLDRFGEPRDGATRGLPEEAATEPR